MSKKIRIGILTNIPTPYRRMQWEYFNENGNFDVTIIYCSKDEKDRNWEYEPASGVKEIFIWGISIGNFHLNPAILHLFRDFDVLLVGGYGFGTVVMAILLLKFFKKPWIMMVDGVSPLELNKKTPLNRVKKYLLTGATAYFANGTISREYLKKNGIPEHTIFNQYMTVDVDSLGEKRKYSAEIKKKIRSKYGIPDDAVVCIYSGRLVPSKGVQDLIQVIKDLKNQGYNIKALIVGGGEYKQELIGQSRDISLDIIFTGYIEPEELYKYYYASDILVLPTHYDRWGLVVNEAMACGLPVIVTDAAGCSRDLIKNNGFVIETGNLSQLSSAIKKITDNKLFTEYGKNSREIISKWTYRESNQSFKDMIHYSLGVRE